MKFEKTQIKRDFDFNMRRDSFKVTPKLGYRNSVFLNTMSVSNIFKDQKIIQAVEQIKQSHHNDDEELKVDLDFLIEDSSDNSTDEEIHGSKNMLLFDPSSAPPKVEKTGQTQLIKESRKKVL